MLKNVLNHITQSLKARLTPVIQERNFIKDWHALSDIDIAQQTLGIETFRKNLSKDAINFSDIKRLLVLAPHQDDEVIGAGGTILQAVKSSVDVQIVYVTDGAGGSAHDAQGNKLTAAQTRTIRNQEAEDVCAFLSAQKNDLAIDNVSMTVHSKDVDNLKNILKMFRPDVVLSPWILDGAPKHRVSNHLLHLATKNEHFGIKEIWGYQVNNGIWANAYIDITSVIEERSHALGLYKSQNQGLRNYAHLADGLAAWNSRVLPSGSEAATQRSFVELFCILPISEFTQIIQKFYLKDLNRTYSPKTSIAEKMKALESELSS